MSTQNQFSRRGFLAMAAASAAALQAQARKRVPVGVLVYAVVDEWNKDPNGTAIALANMGFQGLEITNYMPQWNAAKAKEFRATMDAHNLKCFASHTEPGFFVPGDEMKRMLEMNHILGTQTISCVRGLAASASPAANNPDNANANAQAFAKKGAGKKAPPKKGGGPEIGYHPKASNEADGWKELTDVLQNAAVALKKEGFALSFHNHAVEFQTRKNGVGRPIDILAKAPDLVFTTDTNVAVRAGSDIVAFIKQYPGKCNSLLLTDGPNDGEGHVPALGKGTLPWNDIFTAAEGPGGIKFYLLTHGPNIASSTTRMDAIKADLAQYKVIHG
jgi:sugar phosphate isomerase/epimerase